MDHEQRTAAAEKLDGERAAKIVQQIEQLGADATLAIGPLSERLMEEAVLALGKAMPAPWQVIDEDPAPRVVCPEWKMTRGVGTGDAWLELTEVGPEDEEGFSWISVAVGVGPTRLALELVFRRGLQDYAASVMSNDRVVGTVLKAGMARDESNTRLFFPIDIQAAALAQGFATNDLDKALAPVGVAAQKAVAAKADLDKLIDHVRSGGAGK